MNNQLHYVADRKVAVMQNGQMQSSLYLVWYLVGYTGKHLLLQILERTTGS